MLRRHHKDHPGHQVAAMYRDHATAAYRYAVHLTGSREDADDVVQAAFLEAHRRLARGGEIVNPRAWLATVVRTRASNLRRDRHEAAASDKLETLAGALRHDAADARAELDRVRAVLYELPEAQHQAFVLRYWSDLSYREIAAVLETTESAVESLLVRARAAIVSGPDIPDECLEVRRHLSADSLSAPAHLRHLGECERCRAARTRLTRAAGVAAAALLVPRVHVAQALAATVPGFTTSAATASVGAGGTTLAAGKAGIAAKAAFATLALAGSAALVHAKAHSPRPVETIEARVAAPDMSEEAPATRRTAAPAASPSAITGGAAATAAKNPPRRHQQKRETAAPPEATSGGTQDGSQTGDTQGQDSSSDGDSQGQDPSSGGDTTTSGGSNVGDGDSQGSGGSQGGSSQGGSSQDGSSQDGGGSSGNSGNDDS